jgi:cytoskeletal protein RodZ
MKKLQFLCLLSALAMFLGAGIFASAQSSPSSAPDTQAAPPATSDQSQPTSRPDAQTTPRSEQEQSTPGQTPDQANKPTPDSQAPSTTSASPTDAQSFSGTIVKSGSKYMLQEEASGKTYDIDHQDEVQKFEGKRVKVKGTLDASGKTIHLQ